ncbi:epoxyqueuosine reductase, partial [Microbacterium sp. ZXX196]|nr:epoxyqueuosine reductase [Microbacterium sp. ZXX196]
GSWRGKKPIQRNAIIALAHFKEESAVPDIIGVMKNDPRPVIRGTAAWALGKIGGSESKQALVAISNSETDPEVLQEMQDALARLSS